MQRRNKGKMKVGIVGTRRRDSYLDFCIVRDTFAKLCEVTHIVSGGCSRGGDRFAERLSMITHIPIIIFPANWNKYGKPAGFIRNTDIAIESDILVACVAKDRTGGTEDTIKKFKKFHPKGKLILV